MNALTPYTRAADSEPGIIRIRARTALPFLDINIVPEVQILTTGQLELVLPSR